MHGLDGCSGKGVVGFEQPLQDLFVLETAVVEDSEQTRETLHDLLSRDVEEHLGYTGDTVALDRDELAIAEHLLDPGLGDFENLAHVGQLQQRNGRVQDIVGVRDCAHCSNVNGFLLGYEKRRIDAGREETETIPTLATIALCSEVESSNSRR